MEDYKPFEPNFEGLPDFAKEDQTLGHQAFLRYPHEVERMIQSEYLLVNKIKLLKELKQNLNDVLYKPLGHRKYLICNIYFVDSQLRGRGKPTENGVPTFFIGYWDYLESIHWLGWKIGQLEKQKELESSINPSKRECESRTQTTKLSQSQIALIYAYEGETINKNNQDSIAAKHGYSSTNSGHKLYLLFCKYHVVGERTARPNAETKKTLKNKINLFESVLSHLGDKGKAKALDEIGILKAHLEADL